MEENTKNSFYDFLLANSKTASQKEEPTVKKHHLVLAWLIIFFFSVFTLWIGWNYAISPIFNLPTISFLKAILLYAVAKVLSRGLFSL
jgi:TRAP-type C4-dicarboxylate transport system permease small subunit